jgi:predicted metalloprotease with PDZ domain
VFAGKYFRADDLGHGVTLNTVADAPKELVVPPPVLAKHRALVDQAVKLFGARHFDHYDFLHAVTDRMGGIGLEHHRSSEDQNDPGYFTDWEASVASHNLLPHEFTHSWDGKFRRPADLWTPDYRTPMQDSLLWVYEGQTQFWGTVLEARSGLSTKQQVLDKIALGAADLDTQLGRLWRPLIDTTNDEIISNRRPEPWNSYQRAIDYYEEGLLFWTEADSIIRAQSGGKRSMDDFAHAFFGINDGDWGEVTYTLDDVVRTLNQVQPYDWAGFLKSRVYDVNPHAPLAGFTNSGYRLDYTDTPTATAKAVFKAQKVADFSYSLGFEVGKESKLARVRWGSPAFQAGLVNGAQIIAVDGHAYTDDLLSDAVTAAKRTTSLIVLTVKHGNEVRTFSLPYHDGLRYPRFVKVGSGEGSLDRLFAPR